MGEVTRMLVDELLTQPAPVRVFVGVLAIGGGVLLWRLAPRLAFSGAEPSRCMRPDVRSPRWTDLVRWSYWISARGEALVIIGSGVTLVATTLRGA